MKKLLLTLLLFVSFPAFAADDESVYERVIRTGVLRCGYTIYPPFQIKDANTGAMSGIGYDVMNRMGEMLSIKIDWAEEVGAGSVLQSLESGRIDAVCTPFWRTAERSRIADFTIPVFFSSMDTWVRADETRFADLKDLDNEQYTISTLDGATIAGIVKAQFPKAKTISIPDLSAMSDLLANVVNKKADAVVIENSQALGFLKNNPGTLKKLGIHTPMQVYANGFIVGIQENALKSMLDGALQELLNNGFVGDTLDFYGKNYPDAVLRVAKPYEAQ